MESYNSAKRLINFVTVPYERLEAMCDDSGQSKTVAVERALTLYLTEYDEKLRKLKALEEYEK